MEATGDLASMKPAEIAHAARDPVEEVSRPKWSESAFVKPTHTEVSQSPVSLHSDLEASEIQEKFEALTTEGISKDLKIDQQRKAISQLKEEKETLEIELQEVKERLRKAEQTGEKDKFEKELYSQSGKKACRT